MGRVNAAAFPSAEAYFETHVFPTVMSSRESAWKSQIKLAGGQNLPSTETQGRITLERWDRTYHYRNKGEDDMSHSLRSTVMGGGGVSGALWGEELCCQISQLCRYSPLKDQEQA